MDKRVQATSSKNSKNRQDREGNYLEDLAKKILDKFTELYSPRNEDETQEWFHLISVLLCGWKLVGKRVFDRIGGRKLAYSLK